jgi:hypothetical protein
VPQQLSGRNALERTVAAIEALWTLLEKQRGYAGLAIRIGELEAELAGSKIQDRAEGLISAAKPGSQVTARIVEHVESVIARSESGVLERTVAELEREIEERAWTARAKVLLQASGMSEDEAHRHLRVTSRRTRKPLIDVAREVLEGNGK